MKEPPPKPPRTGGLEQISVTDSVFPAEALTGESQAKVQLAASLVLGVDALGDAARLDLAEIVNAFVDGDLADRSLLLAMARRLSR